MSSLAYGATIALGTTLLIITVKHFLLASKEPSPVNSRMAMMERARGKYLRNHGHRAVDDWMPSSSLLQGPNGFFSSKAVADDGKDDLLPSTLWHDEFFSPFLDMPLMKGFPGMDEMMRMELPFKMDEEGDLVSLVMSVPDIPLKDIQVEVIDGRMVHVRGEETTDSSHMNFDKRFSIGEHLDEARLKAKLTKKGELVVTVPKVGTEKKEEVRKIAIAEEL
ncbi:hypothetical protein ACHAWF_003007 [Thalassiosira exigua]